MITTQKIETKEVKKWNGNNIEIYNYLVDVFLEARLLYNSLCHSLTPSYYFYNNLKISKDIQFKLGKLELHIVRAIYLNDLWPLR